MSKKLQSEFAPKFKIGDKVRVKHGFMDVDYPDMPMGGWAGTVKDVQGSDTLSEPGLTEIAVPRSGPGGPG